MEKIVEKMIDMFPELIYAENVLLEIPKGQQLTTQANALKWGLAKALLISLSSTRTTLRQNRQVRQDASQVLTSTDMH